MFTSLLHHFYLNSVSLPFKLPNLVCISFTFFAAGLFSLKFLNKNEDAPKSVETAAEESYENQNLSLEEEVKVKTSEITRLNRLLQALRESKDRFRHAAFHDLLTDLPNRSMLAWNLRFSIDKCRQNQNHQYALLFIDLNRFRMVNDSLGHSFGDELLNGVGKRLSECVSENDTVARFSGDDFAVLIEDVQGIEEVIKVVMNIQSKLNSPFDIKERRIFTSASIGVLVADATYTDPEEVLRDVDIAMYRAKTLNQPYALFDKSMHKTAVRRLEIETDLRLALERNELFIHYQPVIDLNRGRLAGFEALMRWHHPVKGLISPSDFIPVSELTGLIVPMTLWLLKEVCQKIYYWNSSGISENQLFVSANLSSKHFAEPNLVEQVRRVLNETEIEPNQLKLEITESAVMENADLTVLALRQLKALGVQLSIDDFGTGYSSLSYLHKFPINTLKIDRSFVSTMSDKTENAEIVRTIISLAKNLRLDVIAEGIETIDQFHQLRILDCEFAQGYYFSKPLPADKATDLIKSNPLWTLTDTFLQTSAANSKLPQTAPENG